MQGQQANPGPYRKESYPGEYQDTVGQLSPQDTDAELVRLQRKLTEMTAGVAANNVVQGMTKPGVMRPQPNSTAPLDAMADHVITNLGLCLDMLDQLHGSNASETTMAVSPPGLRVRLENATAMSELLGKRLAAAVAEIGRL